MVRIDGIEDRKVAGGGKGEWTNFSRLWERELRSWLAERD